MNIIVVGCGRVGAELAPALAATGHEVTVLDKDRRSFTRLPEGFAGRTIIGSGFDRDDLAAAGVAEAGALAAVTSGDNTNILTARIAREVFDVPHVVARIYDPRRAQIYERLGIPTVASVTWTTDQVWRRLVPDRAAVEWTSPTGDVSFVERALPDRWAGTSLDGLTVADSWSLTAVRRGAGTLLARPDLIGQPGDIVYCAVRRDAQEDFDAMFEHTTTVPAHGGQR